MFRRAYFVWYTLFLLVPDSFVLKLASNICLIFIPGIYPPQVKVFELRQLSLKFERHLVSEIINFEVFVNSTYTFQKIFKVLYNITNAFYLYTRSSQVYDFFFFVCSHSRYMMCFLMHNNTFKIFVNSIPITTLSSCS